MVYRSGLPYMHEVTAWNVTVLGISSFWWSLLTTVSILNCVSCGFVYLLRTWEFAHLSSRTSDFQRYVEHME